ncbi:cilia- and flagella-associated protein 20-like [Anopheles ziemanni]|uniref:cilia- and flagella-associated protein 20-like n=1 Tax=Anopheles coustani TaxID=139045 RepID=UPI00265A4975|nr:cilia- and flagella-associated protein 20-like [Anopheles coustani]XP_058178731.1 cilia- and flagella-associated protein 20-like [Anopheles ziemanni]
MFRNSFQHGFVSVFTSGGSKPLAIWDVHTKNGHCRRLTDEDLRSLTFELVGVNVATTYMVAPCNPCPSLAIKLPFLVMHVKNLRKFFSFEVQVLDDRQSLRRFRFSNFQSGTRVDIFSSSIPLSLSPNWNEIQLNLVDFTRRAYGTNYVETVRIQVHANVRIKRIYFCDRLYKIEEQPSEFRLFPPVRPCRIAEMRAAAKHHKHPDEPIEMVRPPTPVQEVIDSNQEEAPAETICASTNVENPAATVPTETVNEVVQSVVHFEETEDEKMEQTADEPLEQPGQQDSERSQNLNDN